MQLDSTSMQSNIASEFSGAWILPAALQQLQECGEAALVEELIVMFETDTAERLELLARAVEAADHAGVRRESHTIKGSALQVGAVRVADVCRRMEDVCRQTEVEARKPQPDDMALMFRALIRSFDEVRAVFAARRGLAIDGRHYHGQ
jgi:HPt (histidine-containing phosphotransfer) domain-containing protein